MKRSKRAHQRAVDHHRPVLGVVGAGVGELEALGHGVVELDRPELPRAADRVGHVQVDLRAVERAVARVELVLEALVVERAARAPPRRGPTSPRCRSASRAASRARAAARSRTCRRSRSRSPGSGWTSSSICSSVQKMWASSWVMWRTRSRPCSVPLGSWRCTRPGLGVADRQVAVGAPLVLVELDVRRAVHGLEAHRPALDVREVHVVAVHVPVAGLLPELDVVEDRRLDLAVAARARSPRATASVSSFQIAMPFGSQNGEPGESSREHEQAPARAPSLRWSRARASSSRSRCSSRSSLA